MNQVELVQDRFVPRFVSRDEMNLAEFPLSVLSTRVNPNLKTLEFSDTVITKEGRPVQRSWVITAADKYGLPTSSDDEVLLGLLKLTVDSGLQEPKIFFTRYELLKALRWSTEGRSYTRLTNALDRLTGVRIKATNGFYDNELKSYSTKNFGIIDAYELNNGRENGGRPSFFIWSEVLFKSFQSGFIKKLDFDFFLGLESAVTKRLYRFLDKHFWYKSRVGMNLFTLAHEKIGVSRSYKYPSSIRQQLDPAAEELVAKGFLDDFEFHGKGKGTEVVFYASKAKGSRKRLKKSSNGERKKEHETPFDRLVEELTERGIDTKQAERLLYPREESELSRVQKIIEHFDNLLSSPGGREIRNPAGFLYRAVERPESFCLPNESKQSGLKLRDKKQRREQEKEQSDESERSRYLVERKRKLDEIRETAEPELLERLDREVRSALQNVKKLVSAQGFETAVRHAVEEKLAKLFLVPDFEEWKEKRRKSKS